MFSMFFSQISSGPLFSGPSAKLPVKQPKQGRELYPDRIRETGLAIFRHFSSKKLNDLTDAQKHFRNSFLAKDIFKEITSPVELKKRRLTDIRDRLIAEAEEHKEKGQSDIIQAQTLSLSSGDRSKLFSSTPKNPSFRQRRLEAFQKSRYSIDEPSTIENQLSLTSNGNNLVEICPDSIQKVFSDISKEWVQIPILLNQGNHYLAITKVLGSIHKKLIGLVTDADKNYLKNYYGITAEQIEKVDSAPLFFNNHLNSIGEIMGYLQTKQGLMVQQKSLLNLAACITGFQNLAKLLTKKIVDSYLKQRKQFQVENWEACPLRSSEKNEPIPFQFLDPTIPEHLKELANTELSPMRRAQLQRQYFTVRELTPEEQEKYGLQGVATATFATQNMPAGFKFALYGGHVVPKTSDENIPAEQYLHGTRIDGTDTAFHIEGYTPITETVTHIERDASGKAICESEKPELFNMHYTKSPAIIISTKERFGFPIAETTRAVKKGDLLVTTYGWNAKVVDHFINKGKVKMKVFKHW